MSREAMKQALEALETLARYENPETKIQNRKKDGGPIVTIYPHKVASDAAHALRAALNVPERVECMCGICKLAEREWVELTTQEILRIVDNHTEIRGGLPILYRDQAVDLAHRIQDKIQELNR